MRYQRQNWWTYNLELLCGTLLDAAVTIVTRSASARFLEQC
jgi:hypothetical protein